MQAFTRGLGYQMARRAMSSRPYSSKASTTQRLHRKSDYEIALNFKIEGRNNTIISRAFNLTCEFEDNIEGKTSPLFLNSTYKKYREVIEKLNNCIEYFEIIEENREVINKINSLQEGTTEVFKSYFNKVLDSLDINYNSSPSSVISYKDNILTHFEGINGKGSGYLELKRKLEEMEQKLILLNKNKSIKSLLKYSLFTFISLLFASFIWVIIS